jgi:RNA polymerase sigma-70 factor, ECF subfamily
VGDASSLSATFFLELGGANAGPEAGRGAATPAAAEPALEAALAAACARGRVAFDRITLDDRTFVRHLARALGPGEATPASISALAIEDLYLACACVVGVPEAAVLFSARYGTTIRGAIIRSGAGSDAGEAEQQLLKGLLVGSATSPPKIGSYAGKAPLERWLGVAAQRAALMWLREYRAEAHARDAAGSEPNMMNAISPESVYAKERYRLEFERALSEALDRLEERDRALLRLHVVNAVSVEKIGKMFGVSQPTASRWLAAARETLLDDIKRTLHTRLGVSSTEAASLAGMVASRLDLSLSMLLKAR